MRPRWPALSAMLALVSLAWPAAALGHAELASSNPPAGAELAAPPDAVSLVFEAELRPDGTGFTVTDADGASVGDGELDLTVAERNEIGGAVSIADPGIYTVSWTAVAADGHRASGELTFSVRGEPIVGDAPDTAMAPPSRALPALGIALLLAAGGLGLRRARRAAR